MDFFNALSQYTFLQNTLLASLLISINTGIVGTFVVIRRISYIAGAIAHSVLAGLGISKYLMAVHGIAVISPYMGAILSALIAAIVIGSVSIYAKEREDTIIGAIWAIGMSVGLLFIAKTPGYNNDLMYYLFGNILMISELDLIVMLVSDIAIIIICTLYYRYFVGICFDSEFAFVRGLRVNIYYILLLMIVALTVVILMSMVGIVLVLALLTLPAATAGLYSYTVFRTIIIAIGVTLLSTLLGVYISYGPALPTGSVIVVVLGVFYFMGLGYQSMVKK